MTHFRTSRRQLIALAAATLSTGPVAAAETATVVRVVFTTGLGPFEAVVDTARAPISAGQFLGYVDRRAFDGALFHRAVHADRDASPVKIDVLQAGIDPSRRMGPIAHEPTSMTGLKHLDGVLSVARSAVGSGDAGDFFICIGNQPSLDFGGSRNPDGQGFAAFGRVDHGMDVVRRIWQGETVASPRTPQISDRLKAPVQILSARRAA